MKSNNTVLFPATVTRQQRERYNGHRSVVLWFTGLSGAGKSTLAQAVSERLQVMNCHNVVLDGDAMRQGLCADLGFSPEARSENIRRVGEVAKLFLEAGVIVMVALISPARLDRERVRSLLPKGDFIEIHCRCPLEICEQRDLKGLYQRARRGEIQEFTGISSPYEDPVQAEIVIDTGETSIESSVLSVLAILRSKGLLSIS
jgi:adenylylsulfate kinase